MGLEKGTFHFSLSSPQISTGSLAFRNAEPARTSTPPKGVSDIQVCGASARPILVPIGCTAIHRVANAFEFAGGLRGVHSAHPLWWQSRRLRDKRVFRPATRAQRQAAPGPILGARHQARPQGIAFDIAHHGEQVRILLHGECLVASLPDPPDVAIAPLIVLNVASQQPVRPFRQTFIDARAKYEMEVVGHQTEGEDFRGGAPGRFACERHEPRVITGIMKYRGAGITAVDDVVTQSRPY